MHVTPDRRSDMPQFRRFARRRYPRAHVARASSPVKLVPNRAFLREEHTDLSSIQPNQSVLLLCGAVENKFGACARLEIEIVVRAKLVFGEAIEGAAQTHVGQHERRRYVAMTSAIRYELAVGK